MVGGMVWGGGRHGYGMVWRLDVERLGGRVGGEGLVWYGMWLDLAGWLVVEILISIASKSVFCNFLHSPSRY